MNSLCRKALSKGVPVRHDSLKAVHIAAGTQRRNPNPSIIDTAREGALRDALELPLLK